MGGGQIALQIGKKYFFTKRYLLKLPANQPQMKKG